MYHLLFFSFLFLSYLYHSLVISYFLVLFVFRYLLYHHGISRMGRVVRSCILGYSSIIIYMTYHRLSLIYQIRVTDRPNATALDFHRLHMIITIVMISLYNCCMQYAWCTDYIQTKYGRNAMVRCQSNANKKQYEHPIMSKRREPQGVTCRIYVKGTAKLEINKNSKAIRPSMSMRCFGKRNYRCWGCRAEPFRTRTDRDHTKNTLGRLLHILSRRV